ncbi:MAG: RHS repeat-associated core domain-containing protein [Thermoguttaceae bacterium]
MGAAPAPAVTYSNWSNSPGAASGGGTVESFSYDPNGNRTSADGQSYAAAAPADRLTFDGTYYYTYDKEGNRTLRFKGSSDPTNGATNITQYVWDNRNRLVEVKTWGNSAAYDDGAGTPATDIKYTYDVFDRLVAKDETGSVTLDERYIYDGQDLLLVLNSTGAVQERYLWGPAVDQVLACETGGNVVDWLLTDNQGTVRDVATYSGGQTTVVSHIIYGAFGNIVSSTGTLPRLTYTAQVWDADLGLYYYRARWYDPVTGSFTGQDPLGLGPDTNPYRYCGNGPTNGTDPTRAERTFWTTLTAFSRASRTRLPLARPRASAVGRTATLLRKTTRAPTSRQAGSPAEWRRWRRAARRHRRSGRAVRLRWRGARSRTAGPWRRPTAPGAHSGEHTRCGGLSSTTAPWA